MSNGIFYKDFKSAKWISLLMTIFLFKRVVINAQNSLTWSLESLRLYKGEMNIWEIKSWFNSFIMGWNSRENTFFLLGLSAILIVILFMSEKKSSTYGVLASMPYTRGQIIKEKYKVGLLTITIPFLISFIGLNIFYFLNKSNIYNPYSDIPAYFLINYLFVLAFFSFLFLISTLVGEYMIAPVIGYILLMVPPFIAEYIATLYIEHTGLYWCPKYQAIMIKLNELPNNLNFFEIVYSNHFVDPKTNYAYYTYTNFTTKIITLIAVIIICMFLSFKIYEKVQLERVNKIVMFKQLDCFFKFGVALCSGILLSMIMSTNSMRQISLIKAYVFLIIGFIIGYFIINKIMKVFDK